jgi:hypothetical protein
MREGGGLGVSSEAGLGLAGSGRAGYALKEWASRGEREGLTFEQADGRLLSLGKEQRVTVWTVGSGVGRLVLTLLRPSGSHVIDTDARRSRAEGQLGAVKLQVRAWGAQRASVLVVLVLVYGVALRAPAGLG